MISLVYGVGISDIRFGKRDNKIAYQTWQDMIGRCFDTKLKIKNPTYLDVTCCNEWTYFSIFLEWFNTNYQEGFNLDKDLLVEGNKVYGPETCVFVSPIVNSYCINNKKRELPIGVVYIKYTYDLTKNLSKPYRSSIRKFGENAHSLGHYETQLEAHRAWQEAKISYGKEILLLENKPQIIKGLNRIINKIQNDYDNNLETKDF